MNSKLNHIDLRFATVSTYEVNRSITLHVHLNILKKQPESGCDISLKHGRYITWTGNTNRFTDNRYSIFAALKSR